MGDHPEDVWVLRTICQGQLNLHAVVVGIGEDAVLPNIRGELPLSFLLRHSLLRQLTITLLDNNGCAKFRKP